MTFGWICKDALGWSDDLSYAWRCTNGEHCRLYYFEWRS